MPKAKPTTSGARKSPRSPSSPDGQPGDATQAVAADLSYNEAHTALQLTLAALQASDLDVEEMTGLYRRARAYLERCEAVLASVEQEVLLWDGSSALATPMTDSP